MLRVAELSVIHIHGILACSVSVFSLFAYSISTSSSSPEDFLKSYLLVVVIFFFFVRQRSESNKPATRRGERGGERERKKETEMRQRCSARRTLPPFILPNIPVTNPFALEHNFQSGRDPFTTLFLLLLLLHLSGEDRKERKENKGGGSSCTRTLLAR